MVVAQKLRGPTAKPPCIAFARRCSAPSHQEGEMIEFLAQMPSDTMIFITTAVLGFAATLIGLKWLI
jgi:hypothetical protein